MVLSRAVWQPTYRSVGKPSRFILVANLEDRPSATQSVLQNDVLDLIKCTIDDNLQITNEITEMKLTLT